MPAIQVRHVPKSVHRRLRAKAAASGRSLSGYLLTVLERDAASRSPEEVWRQVRERGDQAVSTTDVVALLHEEREGR